MPSVNFYLKKAEGRPPQSLVYLQMRYHGQKFVYSTKASVSPASWDKKKQRVKVRSQTTANGTVHINDLLDNLARVCIAAYNQEISKGIPTNEALKVHMDDYMYRHVRKERPAAKDPGLFDLIDKFIAGEIGDKKSASTIKSYRTAKNHLQAFEKATGHPVTFASINLEFKYAFVKYLSSDKWETNAAGEKVKVKGLGPNSVAKEIKNIKTFMNEAIELGYTTNISHKSKKFSVKGEETDAVFLTTDELRSLYRHDFSDNKRLEQVRDLFVFSSKVGLRYSDASNIKPENIVQIDGAPFIKIAPQKTGKPVIIPCDDIVLDIFKKYEHTRNHLPPSISNQKYNDYIKEACRLAGFTEVGRMETDLSAPLYKCISSHTGRRNFATNCYLSGMPPLMIMPVTGHKTEKSFLKYIRVTKLQNAKLMAEHMKKDPSERSLRAVG